MYASGKLTKSRFGLRFDSGRSALIRLELSCLYTGGLWFGWIYAIAKEVKFNSVSKLTVTSGDMVHCCNGIRVGC
uniref:Uncharacterized protein n=1 Tax=Siphoviridae sp. ctbbV81 TaxID=2827900 RepID=A0A8S5TQJ7_9CAUD|nr:MAG TPA: hypothetical protein [Siphoviridae sp. ctbbV81]